MSAFQRLFVSNRTIPSSAKRESEWISLPLAPFLTSLAAIGIRPTLHDYERIALVMGTGGRWDSAAYRPNPAADHRTARATLLPKRPDHPGH